MGGKGRGAGVGAGAGGGGPGAGGGAGSAAGARQKRPQSAPQRRRGPLSQAAGSADGIGGGRPGTASGARPNQTVSGSGAAAVRKMTRNSNSSAARAGHGGAGGVSESNRTEDSTKVATFHKDTIEWVNENLLERGNGRLPTPLARRALREIFTYHDLDEDGELSLRELDKVFVAVWPRHAGDLTDQSKRLNPSALRDSKSSGMAFRQFLEFTAALAVADPFAARHLIVRWEGEFLAPPFPPLPSLLPRHAR